MAAQFDVNGYGVIGLEHAIWMYCSELDKVKALAIGETAYHVLFRTGAGVSTLHVRRVS